jgi:hypothetical protein
MDDLWKDVKCNFHKCLDHIPEHNRIVNLIKELNLSSSPNLLLYSTIGFPLDFLWEIALIERFGLFNKTRCIWKKDVTYYETPYFFEIDLLYPHQTNNIEVFSEFIKDIIAHPCIHSSRHIIVLRSLEVFCDKRKSTALRVLLERYSKNVFFICTTYKICKMELPLLSRFLCIRTRIFTSEELETCFTILGRTYHPLITTCNSNNFYFALYISWLAENHPYEVTERLCSYQIPFFYDFLKENLTPSMDDIRKITQKISIHEGTFNMLVHDLLLFFNNSNDDIKMLITSYAAEIDSMCSTTESFRKPLYIEYFLHKVFYDINNILTHTPNTPKKPNLQNESKKSKEPMISKEANLQNESNISKKSKKPKISKEITISNEPKKPKISKEITISNEPKKPKISKEANISNELIIVVKDQKIKIPSTLKKLHNLKI